MLQTVLYLTETEHTLNIIPCKDAKLIEDYFDKQRLSSNQ